jgi:hypothetical protein
VRTFAGQTVTLSFWAKAASGTPSVSTEFQQSFGSGGSPSATVSIPAGKTAITTSWARYSVSVAIPSISGKTIGTAGDSRLAFNLFTSAGSDFNARTNSLGIQSATIDFWGVQVEAGSVATAFQTATGTIQGERAACQRYYFRNTAGTAYGPMVIGGYFFATTQYVSNVMFPVTMRTAPSSVEYSSLVIQDSSNVLNYPSAVSIDVAITNINGCSLNFTVSGATQGRFGRVLSDNNVNGYLAFNAEL